MNRNYHPTIILAAVIIALGIYFQGHESRPSFDEKSARAQLIEQLNDLSFEEEDGVTVVTVVDIVDVAMSRNGDLIRATIDFEYESPKESGSTRREVFLKDDGFGGYQSDRFPEEPIVLRF